MFHSRMALQKWPVLLFVDNFNGHKVILCLRTTKSVFFSPNATSKLQPMDCGIIRNSKHFYRRNLVKRLLLGIEAADEDVPTESVNVRDAIDMLTEAWSCVTKRTIYNCFKSAGFEGGATSNEQMENWSDVIRLKALVLQEGSI